MSYVVDVQTHMNDLILWGFYLPCQRTAKELALSRGLVSPVCRSVGPSHNNNFINTTFKSYSID